MHAATLDRPESFYALLPGTGINLERDRVSLANSTVAQWWSKPRDVVACHPALPDTSAADADIEAVIAWMADQDSMLALSNGDLAPQNCRLRHGSATRLEGAKFQHILLDAAHLCLPLYGGPCWSRIPAEVGHRVESAYRHELATTCPSLLDDKTYAAGTPMTVRETRRDLPGGCARSSRDVAPANAVR